MTAAIETEIFGTRRRWRYKPDSIIAFLLVEGKPALQQTQAPVIGSPSPTSRECPVRLSRRDRATGRPGDASCRMQAPNCPACRLMSVENDSRDGRSRPMVAKAGVQARSAVTVGDVEYGV